jgi:hypothetical protein
MGGDDLGASVAMMLDSGDCQIILLMEKGEARLWECCKTFL